MATKAELLEAVMSCVPYSSHVREIDLAEDTAIRFTWRGDRFRVSENIMVETVQGTFLHGDNLAILMEACIQRGIVAVEERKYKQQKEQAYGTEANRRD